MGIFSDYMTIIRDVEELQRLGFQFKIEEGRKLKIIENYDLIDVKTLNSYRGLVDKVNYYDEETVMEALDYICELEEI